MGVLRFSCDIFFLLIFFKSGKSFTKLAARHHLRGEWIDAAGMLVIHDQTPLHRPYTTQAAA